MVLVWHGTEIREEFKHATCDIVETNLQDYKILQMLLEPTVYWRCSAQSRISTFFLQENVASL